MIPDLEISVWSIRTQISQREGGSKLEKKRVFFYVSFAVACRYTKRDFVSALLRFFQYDENVRVLFILTVRRVSCTRDFRSSRVFESDLIRTRSTYDYCTVAGMSSSTEISDGPFFVAAATRAGGARISFFRRVHESRAPTLSRVLDVKEHNIIYTYCYTDTRVCY